MDTLDARRDLDTRWAYLQDGAALAAMVTIVARDGSLADLGAAIRAMEVDQLESACMAMALIHADKAPLLDPLPERTTDA